MPGGSTPELGNTAFSQALLVSMIPAASVTAATSTTSTYTINGLVIGDIVEIFPQAAIQALLTIGTCWVATANTLSVQWVNSSASNSSATPTAMTTLILVTRVTFNAVPLNNTLGSWPSALE